MTQRPTLVTTILLIAALLSTVLPSPATAQTTTTTEYVGLQGQTRTTPFITYEAFQKIQVNGKTTFAELLSASSADEVAPLLGEPRRVEEKGSGEANAVFPVDLHYDGAVLNVTRMADGRAGVQTIELLSPEWSMTIQEKEIRPGMPAERLDETVRSSIRAPVGESGTETLHHTIIHVAKPDAEQNGQVPLMQNGKTQIVLFIDEEDRTIERIQFFRVFV